MPHVVTDNCLRCRFTECIATCPVACFHGDADMLYIDSVACIDCAACVSACPVHAIFELTDLPEDKAHWGPINAERAKILPLVEEKQEPLPTADARRAELGY